MKEDRVILDMRTSVVGIMLSSSHKILRLVLIIKALEEKLEIGGQGKKKKMTKQERRQMSIRLLLALVMMGTLQFPKF